jgi:hypothetical protein
MKLHQKVRYAITCKMDTVRTKTFVFRTWCASWVWLWNNTDG